MKYWSLIILNVLFILTSCNRQKEEAKKPNIILISADDLGWSDLGCYGSEIATPNIDKLAEQGMRFTQFHNTSKCFPSRACLITGVYAQDCGYHETYKNPITNAVTIGEVLQTEGYLTYWSGKHHGVDNPFDRGFDHYYGLRDGCCNYFNPGISREGEPEPARKRIRYWCSDNTEYHPYTPGEKSFYTTDYFTNYALQFIDEANEKQQPFFLYLAYTAPHDPLMAWPQDIQKYRGVYDAGYESIRKTRYQKQLKLGLIDTTYKLSKPTYEDWDKLSEKERELESQKMEVYAAMIDRMDQNIGRVLDKLKEIEINDNTLIFFVSDNGASAEVVELKNDNDLAAPGSMERWLSLGKNWANVSNTPFRLYKNHSYEGGINTPFIAWWPQKIKAGTLSDFSGHFIDVMPTLVDIAKASYPEEFNNEQIVPMRGISLLPVLEQGKAYRREPIYWAWAEGRAMQQGEWKIVKQGLSNPWDLYNIKNDPTETLDLSANNPELVAEMDSVFQIWLKAYYSK